MRSLPTLLLGLVLIHAGCEKRVYELELTPDKGKLQRQLTGHIETSGQGQPQLKPLGDEELARIASLYKTNPPRAGGPKHKFAGAFVGRLPDDIGGHGAYHEWTSEFGAARLYVERFRGNDDVVETLDKTRETLARVVELLLQWVDDTWGNQPEHGALHRFVDRDLRRDLENIAFYLKAAELHGSASDVEPTERVQRELGDVGARIPQYLVERQYFEFGELPKLSRVLRAMNDEGGQAEFMLLLQGIVRRKIGVAADEPLPPALALFADSTRLLKSLNDSLRKSDEYQVKLAAWEQTPVNERSEVPEEPISVLTEILSTGFGIEFFFGRTDELVATLHAATKPISTNGTWDADRKAITWKKHLPSDKPSGIVPEIAYAVWTDPADAAQLKLLGRVALRGQSLFGYCMWRNSLTQDELQQWSKFLNSTEPADEFMQRLEKFRFAGEPEEDDGATRSGYVRELMLGPGE